MPGIFDKKNDVSLKKKNSLLIGSITGFLYLLFAIFLFFQINHLVTNEEAIAKLTLTLIISGAIITAISFFVTWFIIGNSLADLPKIEKFAKKIASGQLNLSYKSKRKDEIGKLIKSLINIRDRFAIVIQSTQVQTKQLSIAADNLNQTTDTISQGASQQASSVEEISVIIEEILSNIRQNTANTARADEISQESFRKIIINNDDIQKTVSAIKNISKETGIIEDIAIKTNILSLNALIQAAQAGEYGRAFNVIAQEVSKLAERSKTGAEEIANLVVPSLEQINNTGLASQEIIPEIKQASELIKQVTLASTEQERGVSQINDSVQQLNEISQQNAATSEEISATYKQLTEHVNELNQVISYFMI